jgi:hypothetical protein
MEQVYTATVTGDTMEGTITMSGGQGGGRGFARGDRTFTAKRVEG